MQSRRFRSTWYEIVGLKMVYVGVFVFHLGEICSLSYKALQVASIGDLGHTRALPRVISFSFNPVRFETG